MPSFIDVFLSRQQAKGHTGPLFDHLATLSQPSPAQSNPAPAEGWLPGHPALPPPTPAPRLTPPDGTLRTVHDFTAELTQARAERHSVKPEEIKITYSPAKSLTACMDSAPCPATARKIYQVLFELALISVQARGVPVRPDVAVYHLPLELLAAHIERSRVTVWRNLQSLFECGVIAAADHYGTLRGQTAVTGKLWAVSLCPARVLGKQAAPVRVTMSDLRHPWRDLDRDARSRRTAYAITRTEGRQQAEQEQREAKAEQTAQARALADERRATRQKARKAGEKVPHGRAAAKISAAKTRAEKSKRSRPARPPPRVQQSLKRLKAVGRAELEKWVLAGFSPTPSDVTLTVASGSRTVLDAVFSLASLTGLSASRRNAVVEETARALATGFEDVENFGFWAWLIWQTLRAHDQAHPVTDDVLHIILRVWHDIKADERMGNRKQLRPAALVVNELRNCGLYDELKATPPTRVGKRPN